MIAVAFDLLEDILAFLYATGEEPNPEDDMLNQEDDEERDGDCGEMFEAFLRVHHSKSDS